jgi:hypothetical protein
MRYTLRAMLLHSKFLIRFFFLSPSQLSTFSTSFFSAMRYTLRAMLLHSNFLIRFFFLSPSQLPTFSTSFFSAMRYTLRAKLLHSNSLIRFFFLSPSQLPTFSTSFFSAFPPGRRRRPLWAGGRIFSRGIVQQPVERRRFRLPTSVSLFLRFYQLMIGLGQTDELVVISAFIRMPFLGLASVKPNKFPAAHFF